MKISQIAEASAAIEDGEWVESSILPGVSFRTRGLDADPCRRAFQKHIKRLGWKNKRRVLPRELDYLNALVLYDAATLDWKGIQENDGKEIPFSKERLGELLFKTPERKELRDDLKVFYKAAHDAAQFVGDSQLELEEDDEGNSGDSSSGVVNMADVAQGGRKTAKN